MPELTPRGRALFLEVVDLPPAERDAAIDRSCAGVLAQRAEVAVQRAEVAALRAEVAALLAADAQADGFLEPPALGLGADDELAGRWLEGHRIGQYVVVRRIGMGGMGTVYVAEQAHPRRRVALKLLRLGLVTRELRRRFEREVEILGQLQHPGIAAIYEAGTHDSELGPIPFFALEYIPEACTITEWAARERLDVRARVELFARVCDAVAYAHAAGVVHRDLKPSNMLVGRDGAPRLIDFGVARWVDDGDRQASLGTSAGELLGTLHYMSPEQFEGPAAAVGPAGDVHALGVVLYELVTGTLPFPVEGAGAGRIAELIRTHSPSPPTLAGPRWRGLDAVVLMALAKSPQHRYPSATEMAADLRRALLGEPVRASRSLREHRLRRAAWRARRALPWGAAAAVAALGVVALRPSSPRPVVDAAPVVSAPAVVDDSYLHRIAVAERALAAHDLARAKVALGSCAVAERNWEWHRMLALVDRSAQVMPLGAPANALVHDPGRGLLVALTADGALHGWRIAEDGPIPRFVPTWTVALGDEVAALQLDPILGLLYVAGDAGLVHVRSIEDGADRGSFAAGERTIWGLARAGGELVLSRRDGTIERWSRDPAAPATVPAAEAWTRVMQSQGAHKLGTLAIGGDEVYAARELTGVAVHRRDDGRHLRDLAGTEGVEAILVEDDTVYTAGWDRRISAYARDRGALERTFTPQDDGILDLLRIDGSTLASAGRDGAIVLWDVESGEPRETLRGHDFGVDAIALDPSRRWLASVSLDGTMRTWDLGRSPTEATLSAAAAGAPEAAHDKIQALAFTDGGAVLVSAGGPQWGNADRDAVVAWSSDDGRLLATALDHRATVDAVATDAGGTRVATASRDGELVLRDRSDLRPRARVAAHSGPIRGLAFDPGGARLVSVGDDGTLAIWTLADAGSQARLELQSRVPTGLGALWDVAWTEHGITVAGAGGLARVRGDDVDPVRVVASTTARVLAVAALPGDRLVVGSDDGTLALVEGATGTTLWSTPTFGRAITDLAVSPDGTRVASASQDYRVRLHDASTGEHVYTVGAHESVATSVAFAPDGASIASGGYDRRVRLWRAPTAQR